MRAHLQKAKSGSSMASCRASRLSSKLYRVTSMATTRGLLPHSLAPTSDGDVHTFPLQVGSISFIPLAVSSLEADLGFFEPQIVARLEANACGLQHFPRACHEPLRIRVGELRGESSVLEWRRHAVLFMRKLGLEGLEC